MTEWKNRRLSAPTDVGTRENCQKMHNIVRLCCSQLQCCSAAECSQMSIFAAAHVWCENDPRFLNCSRFKQPQFPQRKPHSVHFCPKKYAMLVLKLINN